VSIRIPLGRRVFAPSTPFTLLTLLLCAAFLKLGLWQWHRGEGRQAEWDKFAAGAGQVVPLGARGIDSVPRFQRIDVAGRFDADHQFLLDNRSYQGHAGFEVLTPLQRPDGRTLIVDRGWVPFSGIREHLPAVAFQPHEAVTVVGRVADLPSAGLASGRAPPADGNSWPKVTAFPSMAQLSAALGKPVEAHLVLLDPKQDDGYVRDWQPPGMDPMRHWSYAVQWWSFAVVLLVIWVVMSTRRPDQP
jgi:surfeit locus 1 family protein